MAKSDRLFNAPHQVGLTTLHIAAFGGDAHGQSIQRFIEEYLTAEAACSRGVSSEIEHILFHLGRRFEAGEVGGVDDDVTGRTRHLTLAGPFERLSIGLADVEQAIAFPGFQIMDRVTIGGNEPHADHDS